MILGINLCHAIMRQFNTLWYSKEEIQAVNSVKIIIIRKPLLKSTMANQLTPSTVSMRTTN